MNDAYMPKPSSAATAFVVHTPRIRIIRMSTSGWWLRDSLRTHTTSRTIPAPSTSRVRADSHPHPGASLTASSTPARPADINAAPLELIRPGTRTGDSGTNR